MIRITESMKSLIESAPAEGVHCLVATASSAGWPQLGPKGSVIVHDETTLAFWERARAGTLANLLENPRVAVYYRNPKRRDELPGGSGWRFYGMAEILDSGEVRERIMMRTPKSELDRDPDRKGAAVLIHLVKITDISGTVLQKRD